MKFENMTLKELNEVERTGMDTSDIRAYYKAKDKFKDEEIVIIKKQLIEENRVKEEQARRLVMQKSNEKLRKEFEDGEYVRKDANMKLVLTIALVILFLIIMKPYPGFAIFIIVNGILATCELSIFHILYKLFVSVGRLFTK